MIAKQVLGSNFAGVLSYVSGKEGAQRIGGNMAGQSRSQLAAEFRISRDLNFRVKKCVYHATLSVAPDEELSDRHWNEIADAYTKGMGFHGSQYVVYRHTDTHHHHIHIIASRIRITDGSTVSDAWNYRRSEVLVRQLEQQFELKPVVPSWSKKERSPHTGEVRRYRRTGEVSRRVKLQQLISKALQGKPCLQEFIARLEAQEVEVQLRRDERGKILGISYKLGSVPFQGRQIGRGYAWTQIQNRLSVPRMETQQRSQDEETAAMASDRIAQERKRQLRERYLVLQEQVRQKEAFRDSNHDEIDIAIAILTLKQGEAIDEVEAMMTQSDRVRLLKETLPKQKYLVSEERLRELHLSNSYCNCPRTRRSGGTTRTTGDVDL
ncbi:relaxase/mobilization nuclease domain-containing protein [Chroococcidiopsis sp. CCNUC1]|uniref:relaxase/mobilization nuclease domain-containing protein n=1 Tax=Chroococcidiopsis sp. CCNUC1 TaxID=2653189 RepID=UPI0020213097|nr:relaxase/mobilization nuclease domain-containing protein [Chroococcidiopsis sp. CCNUC1]URD48731.1 relaxase/mobilization nuclease domain-containing protein [Chroococcidiopsis sp. CCNUC1]